LCIMIGMVKINLGENIILAPTKCQHFDSPTHAFAT